MSLERLEISSEAEHVARVLLDGEHPRYSVDVHLPDGSIVAGKSFIDGEVEIIVTENFMFEPRSKIPQTNIIFRVPYSDN